MIDFIRLLKEVCEEDLEPGTKVYVDPNYLKPGAKKSGVIDQVHKQNYTLEDGRIFSKCDVSTKPYKKK